MNNYFHQLDVSGVSLPEKLNNPFDYEPHELCQRAWEDVMSWPIMNDKMSDFFIELCQGKMIGVLIVAKDSGEVGFLAAFSGQIEGSFSHEGFVPAVFDYLPSDSRFRRSESLLGMMAQEIKYIDKDIENIRTTEYFPLQDELARQIAKTEHKMRTAKARRDEIRAQGPVSASQEEEMIRESQFWKAELRRCRQRAKAQLQPIEDCINELKEHQDDIARRRRELSEKTQAWLFAKTILTNAMGEQLSVADVFARSIGKTPPSGAGECCAPKLLNYAFTHRLRPIAIAEYWYGNSPQGEIRHHGCAYPACRSKCWPLLPWMLQGIDIMPAPEIDPNLKPIIIYENSDFCIVKKPAGLLSVPGAMSSPSVESLLQAHYGAERDVRMAHRLDQATSGLMIATFGIEAYRRMQALFVAEEVKKTYIALLESDPTEHGIEPQGAVLLSLMPDIVDRPRQRVSSHGLPACTCYRIVGHSGNWTRVEFCPATGRTHQLRVHSASPLGLNAPIVGDRLYGNTARNAPRLMLHASCLDFSYPDAEHPYHFEWQPDF